MKLFSVYDAPSYPEMRFRFYGSVENANNVETTGVIGNACVEHEDETTVGREIYDITFALLALPLPRNG
jgi:hypothetical protein